MDGWSIFAAAGTLAQFVIIASTLLSQAAEIRGSAGGASDEVLSLESVYGNLQKLSQGLKTSFQGRASIDVELKESADELAELAGTCKKDCDHLLEIIAECKVGEATNGRWKSMRKAARFLWRSREIKGLEQRLERAQRILDLRFAIISNYYHRHHSSSLEKLKGESEELHVRQSEKFRELRDMLSSLSSRINHITVPTLPADIQATHEAVSDLTLVQQTITKQQIICSSLDFDRRTARHGDIHEAHQNTFRWIYEPHGLGDGKFRKWLTTSGWMIWIAGKPGSGKSSLMKFIADNPSTKKLLSHWAPSETVHIADHYFWNAGTEMQKSQHGLLQSLLHAVFRNCPELIRECCKARWSSPNPRAEWTAHELRNALKKVATADSLGAKFCFFIDGLDEYKGNHLELCEDLLQLSKSPHIKLCVSSRPWNVFEDNLGKDKRRRLNVHEFTRGDIYSFASSRLREHSRWEYLATEEPYADALIDDIVQMADGVFLWVYLVTKLLRDGLTNGDSVSDLRSRLHGFPTELESFFKHILEQTESLYHAKMSGCLQIAARAGEPLPVDFYSFHVREYDDQDYALKMPIRPPAASVRRSVLNLMKRRLNAWCHGLLEIRKDNTVSFLHRTVVDFLRTQQMSDFLATKQARCFNTSIAMLRAYTACIKTMDFSYDLSTIERRNPGSYSDTELTSHIINAIELATDVEAGENISLLRLAAELLDHIELVIEALDLGQPLQLFSPVPGFDGSTARLFFRESIVRMDAVRYLSGKLLVDPNYLQCLPGSPLAIAALAEFGENGQFLPEVCQRMDMFKLLLDHGEDPNDASDYYMQTNIEDPPGAPTDTSWTLLIASITGRGVEFDELRANKRFLTALNSGLLSLFLRHGADPNALIRQPARYSCLWRDFLLRSFQIVPGTETARRFLQVLDEFFDAGADVEAVPSRRLDLMPSLEETVFEEFFNLLRSNRDNSSDSAVGVLADTANRLLTNARDTSADIRFALEVIDSAFPPELATELHQKHSTRQKTGVPCP